MLLRPRLPGQDVYRHPKPSHPRPIDVAVPACWAGTGISSWVTVTDSKPEVRWAEDAPTGGPPMGYVRALAFVVGAASLGAEISAARLLAPYFGASTIIWANTIATVLLALSAGYALGGRLADRRADLRGLCAIVTVA